MITRTKEISGAPLELSARSGLSDLIDAFSTAIYVKDRGHRRVMLNEACCRALGRSRKALAGKTDDAFLPKPEADKIRREEEEIFSGGGERRGDETFTDAEGAARTYSTTKTLFTERSGRAWLIGVMNDVTTHKRVLEDVRFMASLLEAENEASISGILIVDGAERILSTNRRFSEMWGIDPGILATKSDAKVLRSVLRQIVDPERFRRRVESLYRHRDEKSYDQFELRDGRVFERYSAPAVGKDGVYYGRVWHFRDITDIRKLSALTAEMRQRRELDALKDQFIGTVSHELRTPLTIVRTAVDSLRGGVAGALTAKQQEVADLCLRNILRLNKMINNLLHISRLESGCAKARLARLDLRPLLAEMEENFGILGRAGGREVSFKIDAPADLPAVLADPELIGEVLYNLLDNAARFARASVRVVARRKRVRTGDRDVDGVCVKVIDDGPGIPPGRVGLLFNKFSQVERAVGGGYKGTGLGLSICKEIMALHGCEIGVKSVPGKTCFHFFLPEWSRSAVPASCAAAGAGRK